MHRNEENVFAKLRKIETIAKQNVKLKFTSLAHLLNQELLGYAFRKLNKCGSPGADGVTMQQFGENLDENIAKLHGELKTQKYRADNIRRVYIPKSNGNLRPLGIPSIKDRIAQRAVTEILNTIYEPEFLEVSYGFRPQRSAHDALDVIKKTVNKNPIAWIVDVDIKGYFDHVNHEWMIKFLQHRIADKSLLNIISRWLKAGIMDNGVVTRNEEGVPQGGPVSPILANIYLHYVLDLWFEKKYRPQCQGHSFMVRYADDFVVGFERELEARKFLEDLKERLTKFGLEIAEEKSQIVRFGRNTPAEQKKTGPTQTPQTFKFLGFIHYMKSRGEGSMRRPSVARKPKRESMNKFLQGVKKLLKSYMHSPVTWQRALIARKLKGFYNYFALHHCIKALANMKWHVERLWIMTLRRRSQRHRIWWKTVRDQPWFRLPEPRLIKRS